MELILTGRQVHADEALKLGIVNQVFPHEQLREKTMEFAQQIASGPRSAIQLARYMIYAGETSNLWDSLQLSHLAPYATKEEGSEGARAFGEKRKPDWP